MNIKFQLRQGQGVFRSKFYRVIADIISVTLVGRLESEVLGDIGVCLEPKDLE